MPRGSIPAPVPGPKIVEEHKTLVPLYDRMELHLADNAENVGKLEITMTPQASGASS